MKKQNHDNSEVVFDGKLANSVENEKFCRMVS